MARSGLNWSPPKMGSYGFEFGRFMATFTALMSRLGVVKEEFLLQLQMEILRMKSRIESRTPVDRSPERDDIVSSELWVLEEVEKGTKVIWKLYNEARNPNNNFPYPGLNKFSAYTLEYGWSDQAPEGMVRISLEEFRAELGDLLRKAVRKT